jgi:DNA-binding CsgD family transcriptional regulator
MADRSSAGTTELEIRDRAIVERVAAGLALRAVGAEYGLSHTKVRRIAARAGVHFLHPGGRSWPAHRIAELRQLRSEGLTMGEIAQRLGASKTTVHKLIKRKKRSSGKSKYEVRNRTIAARVAAGGTRSDVGAEFGISPQRVSQIMLALWAADRISD